MIAVRLRSWIAIAALLPSCTADGGSAGGTDTWNTSDPTASTAGTGSTGGGTTAVAPCEPTTDSVRATIFTPTCAVEGCHDATSGAAGLVLAGPDVEAQLVGVASGTCDGKIRVVPGNPAASFLLEKVSGEPDCGVRMPVDGTLPAEHVTCISDWIDSLQGTCETCGGNVCLDLQTDAQNCGACGQACPGGIACTGGQCACPGTAESCGGSCVDTNANPEHCGGCGMACAGGEVCLSGVCSSDCGTLTECAGACVDLDADLLNCGGCGNACAAGESCTAGACACETLELGYAADIEPLLSKRCTAMGCHASIGPMPAAGELKLTAGDGYGNLVGVASSQCNGRLRVEPGTPSASYLVDKLKGINLCFGTKMPKTGAGLSAAEIEQIEGWICGGANP